MVSATVVSFQAERSHHMSYSIKDKREFVQAIDIIMSTSASWCDACSHVDLPHMYYAHIKKVVEKVDALEKSAVCILYNMNGSACKIHPGPTSLLTTIQDNLAHFVKHARQS